MKSPKNKAKNQNSTQPLLFEINIADLHLGKLSWPEAEAAPHQDTITAEELCKEAVKAHNSKPFNQSMHLLPWGEEALGL